MSIGVPATIAIAALTLASCSSDDSIESAPSAEATSSPGGGFCDAMSHLIVLLAPTEVSSPSETRSTFEQASTWFEQAARTAPASISDDVAAYGSAYSDYIAFLDDNGYNLNLVFSTDEGRDLAIETSHSLTEPIVEHTITECGLSFGDEEHDPPAN